MTQGIWVDGRRPNSKKEVREAVVADPATVNVEATSIFGNEYDGPLSEWDGKGYITFVGPDPATKRSFFGNIAKKPNGGFSVK